MDKRKILSRILAAVLLGMMVLSVAATLLIYLFNAR
jgi:hypothetical protein